MANENTNINVREMTIIPSLSFNKHINAVQNYSLQDSIDMRMSIDRTRLENIEEFIQNEVIFNCINNYFSDYIIKYICACKNEIILFVTSDSKLHLFRYNEKTNTAKYCYGDVPYSNGEIACDYTYNVNGDLIVAFCEYDGEEKQPLRTINLNEQLYQNADINLSHDKLTIKPAIQLSNFDDVFYRSGLGYTGWHYIYIQYKINESRYTEWYRMGFPIKLLKNARNVLFTDDCTNPKTGSNLVKYGNNFVLNTGYINKTYTFDFNIDTSFYQYRIGVIVRNNTISKHFVTEFIDCISDKQSFIFDTNNLKEEEFIVETRQNFYNVKNIINHKNILYCANYETYDFGDIDTNSIKLYTKIVDKRDIIIPEVRTDSVILSSNPSIKISKDAYNFENNILWFLLTLHYQKPSLGILGSLGNVQNGILYIRRQGVIPSGGFRTVEYTAKIENVYCQIKACTVQYGESQTAVVYYPIIKFLDTNGNNYSFTPFYNDEEPNTWTWDNVTEDYLPIIKIGYDTMTAVVHSSCTNNTIISYALVYKQLINPSDPDYEWQWSNSKMPAFSKYLYLYYGVSNYPRRVIYQSEDTTNNNYQKMDSNYYSAEYLINHYPNDLQIVTTADYTQNKEYYLTTLPNNEVFDFYIHFINKYGEISDGYRLKNNHGITKINNKDYVIFYSIVDFHFYYLPADKKIKDIDINSDIFYSSSGPVPYRTPSIIQYNNLSSDIKNYFEDIKFKDLYTNNLSNYSAVSSQGSGLFNFIPYYNGTRHLFKVNGEHINDYETQELFIDFNNFDFDNITGYFISYNKIEFTINSVGVRIPASSSVLSQITQYYSLLNDILDYKSFGNFISDVIKSDVKPFYSVNDIYQAGYKEKTINNNISLIYSSIPDLEVAYAGENKFGRRSKSTILTELENLISRQSEFVKGVSDTNAYISFLSNINNNFYLNEPTLYKFSNYYYNNDNRILKGNNLGEWYSLTHILYNESGVCYSYKVDPDDQDTNHIDMDIENLDNLKYGTNENNPYNLIPVGIETTKFVSLHSFNIETKSNPFQIGNKIFIAALNTLNYFGQFIKECWEYDDFIFQKYDKYKQKNKFTNTIIYSNVINDESIINRWQEFLTESYKFISENKGEIINLAVIGNIIFVHCTNALYYLEFKDYINTTEESLQIVQSSIKDIAYKEIVPTNKGVCGLQNKQNAIVGNFGYIFFDKDSNKIYRFSGEKLDYLDYNIIEYMKTYKPIDVKFANDVEHNNLYIQLEFEDTGYAYRHIVLLYDYQLDSFVSKINNYTFSLANNTKDKLYFLRDINSNRIIDNIGTNKRINITKIRIINDNNSWSNVDITNKLSFIFNMQYDSIKFVESLEWNLYKYLSKGLYIMQEPIEVHRQIYAGDYIRIYNDCVDTGWIDIRLNNISGNVNEYNQKDNYKKPYWYLGRFIMNMFRNIKKISEFGYKSEPTIRDYSDADDKTRLYGKWFIIEFGFNTYQLGDEYKKIEFENIKLNVSQQTNI